MSKVEYMNQSNRQPPAHQQSLNVREPNSFGKRKETHSIVITRNGTSRHYAVNPLYFSVFVGLLAMFGVGYFSATAYLVLRDDLISAQGARNARMQHEYEDRIAALRTRLDHVTSRQLLDQQAIEVRVSELIERQKQLGGRGDIMRSIVKKAREFGLKSDVKNIDTTTTGAIKPEKQAAALKSGTLNFALRGLGNEQNLALAALSSRTPAKKQKVMEPDTEFSYRAPSSLFASVSSSIANIDDNQKRIVANLRHAANKKLGKIAKLLNKAGAVLPKTVQSQIGGPFEPLDQSASFLTHLEALDYSLDALDTAQSKVNILPIANPVPGKAISSRFGSRIDPFKGSYAMHSGLDFKVSYGVNVKATGAGKVIFAGRKGGYGNLVEIQHENGFTTRFAHLSRILVSKGQKIEAGTNIGKVGSTGRSTGPHLHYEVRVHGVAVNPKTYINVGNKLKKLL